ncbi:NADH-quinone oxidoreductase subunit L [bacterium]|nr:NADH-quinone oxidoreductase subunit L [bacterium]
MEFAAKLLLLFPLIGVILNGLFGRKHKKDAIIHTIACSMLILSFLCSVIIFFGILGMEPNQRHVEVHLFDWIVIGGLNVAFKLLLDPLSCVMLLVVTGVGSLIHIYSIGYMHGDVGYYRFFTYLNLFVFAMLLLVTGGNFLMMFIGWEGVGLCSYLLIGYYFQKKSASDAGKKAFVVNRIGDFGFILGIMLIFTTFGSIDYLDVFSRAPDVLKQGGGLVTAITLLLFIGAIGKSAQIPLYVWLPDAMEGPTPVSALIHAATMVTAGVYMVSRCSVLFMLAPLSLSVVATIGAITALFAASMGLLQNDIKRVLAYSTISQLGYMFLGCGVAAFGAGIFHLMTHAFFKACLFMCAGSVMHAMQGELDMRKMGDLKRHMPRTYWTYFISTLAICGIPPFAGFFSKDEILYKAFTSPHSNIFLWVIGALAACMTAFYMFRSVFMTFHGKSRADEHVLHHLHESPYVMTIPLIILAFLASVGGFLGVPHALMGNNRIEKFLETSFEYDKILNEHHAYNLESQLFVSTDPQAAIEGTIPQDSLKIQSQVEETEGVHHDSGELITEYILMVVSVLIALIGIFIAYIFYIKNTSIPFKLAAKLPGLYKFVYNKYFVDEFYNSIFVDGTKELANKLCVFDANVVDGAVNGTAWLTRLESSLSIWFDEHIVDGLVNAVAFVIQTTGAIARKIQTGFVQNYGLIMATGIFVILCFYILF